MNGYDFLSPGVRGQCIELCGGGSALPEIRIASNVFAKMRRLGWR